MGTTIADALFTKTQQRVLGLLFGKPDKSFYMTEIFRAAQMGRGTVRRELDRLEAAGLVQVSQAGNQRHYQANPESPIYDELLSIVRKTFGVADVIRDALQAVDDQFDAAFVYGSVAKGEDTATSDIDLMVVSGELAYADLMAALEPAETQLARPVNPTIYTPEQISAKLRDDNVFVKRVMEQPKLWIKGTEDVIRKPGESGKNREAEKGAA
jgi:predicted nucleotidyltransferase